MFCCSDNNVWNWWFTETWRGNVFDLWRLQVATVIVAPGNIAPSPPPQKKYSFPNPHLIRGSLVSSPSLHPKQHPDRFSHLCRDRSHDRQTYRPYYDCSTVLHVMLCMTLWPNKVTSVSALRAWAKTYIGCIGAAPSESLSVSRVIFLEMTSLHRQTDTGPLHYCYH